MSKKTKKLSLVLATNNAHKVVEIKSILKKAGFRGRILTLNDFPRQKPVVENKKTIEGNARKKALEVAKRTGCVALADDTGLFIHALGGRPGVYSARFAGPGCTYQDNNQKVLRLLKNMPPSKRGADFRCIASLATPEGRVAHVEGKIKGKITTEIRGKTGFGYDPIFWVSSQKKTFSEMGSRLKNKLSHRSLAFQKIPTLIRRFRIH